MLKFLVFSLALVLPTVASAFELGVLNMLRVCTPEAEILPLLEEQDYDIVARGTDDEGQSIIVAMRPNGRFVLMTRIDDMGVPHLCSTAEGRVDYLSLDEPELDLQ